MSIKEARLIIQTAYKEDNEKNRKVLLEIADKILADCEKLENTKTRSTDFPIPIFRRYKGTLHDGQLLKGWRVSLDGKVFKSPSAAAVFISGHPENGWRMWKYIDETTNSEQPIDRLRNNNG